MPPKMVPVPPAPRLNTGETMRDNDSKIIGLIDRMKARHDAWETARAKRSNSAMLGAMAFCILAGAVIVLLYLAFR